MIGSLSGSVAETKNCKFWPFSTVWLLTGLTTGARFMYGSRVMTLLKRAAASEPLDRNRTGWEVRVEGEMLFPKISTGFRPVVELKLTVFPSVVQAKTADVLLVNCQAKRNALCPNVR